MPVEKKDVMRAIYDRINEVIGAGDQLFTMTFPAQPLNYRRFVYDTSDRNSVLTKPYVIAEAEFRLSEQMFNPVPITASSNGKKLSTVYNTLINNYVPKITELAPFFRDRAGLSKFLLQPSGELDERGESISRMALTNILYEKYLNAKNDWEKKKNNLFDDFKRKNQLDAYAKWMSSEGMVEEERLNNLYNDVVVRGHLHEVMTLLGYINSSSVSEQLEAVKQRMRHSVRLSLDESMLVYPVQFQPSNWFMAMTPNLQPKDLTMAKDVLSDQLRQKRKLLSKAKSNLTELELSNVSPEKIEELEKSVRNERDAFESAQGELMDSYGEGVVTAVKTYLNAKSIASEMAFDQYIDSYTGGGFSMLKTEMADMGLLPDGLNTSKKIIDTFEEATDAVAATYKKHQKVSKHQRGLLTLQSKLVYSKAHEMGSEKIRLKERIDDLEADVNYLSGLVAGTHGESILEAKRLEKIDALLDDNDEAGDVAFKTDFRANGQLEMNKGILKQIKEWYPSVKFEDFLSGSPSKIEIFDINNKDHHKQIVVEKIKTTIKSLPKQYDLIPKKSEEAEIDGFFTDVVIKVSSGELDEKSKAASSSSQFSADVSVGFASASVDHQHATASNEIEKSFLSSDMEIGLRVAKVSFDRGGWFNPALFDMTNSFYHLAKLKAGAGFSKDEEKNNAAMAKYAGEKTDFDYLMPSFPVAMVIAKDITIKVTSNESASKYSRKVESESTSASGGVFGFSVSGGKSSQSMAESSFHGHTDKSFYMRIPGPQILGYYQQFVKEDKSLPYEAMFNDKDKDKEEAPLMKALHEFDIQAKDQLPSVQEIEGAEKLAQSIAERKTNRDVEASTRAEVNEVET